MAPIVCTYFHLGMLPSPISRVNSSSPQQPNPLSIRLYKVLAANFDDDATKEAVQTLAELYAPGHGVPKVKGKQVQRDQGGDHEELDEEEEDHITGTIRGQPGNKTILSTSIETVPGEIAAKARRNLRRDVESKLGESSRRFLAAFSEVDKVHYSDRCLNSKC